MSDTAQHNVRVELRHVVLADGAPITEHADGRVFLALDEPPPVRSVLAVKDGGSSRAMEVLRVVEVPESGGSPGVHGRWVDAEALARFAAVGTERLPGGTREPTTSQASADVQASDEDPSGAQLAMPAPVMIGEESSEPIDVSADKREDDDDGGDEAEDQDVEAGDDPPKKRKGRKRR